MLKVAQEDLLEDPLGRKEGRSDAKIGSMRTKGSLGSKRGRFKHTGQCPVPQGATIDRRDDELE